LGVSQTHRTNTGETDLLGGRLNFDTRLLRLLDKSKWIFVATIALGITGGALALGQAHSFAHIVDQVFLKGQGFQQVSPALMGLLAIIIFRAIVNWGYEATSGAISKPIKQHLRHRLYQNMIDKGPIYTSHESTGELVNTTVEGVEALDAYYGQYIPQAILAVLIPLITLFFIIPVDWISALVMLVTAPLIPFFMALIGRMAQVLTRRQWLSLSRMSAYFLDVLQGLPTLKTLGRSREQGKTIARVSRRYAETTMSVLRVAFLSALTLELVATLSTAVVAVQLGIRLLYGWISFEQALFVLALAPEFYLPLRMLGTRFHAGMAGVEAGKRVFSIIRDEKSVQVSSDIVSGGDVSGGKRGRIPVIHFRDVQFEYEEGRGGIHGVSFSIEPGEKIALVGESGAGKSTLTALLMGFLQPAQGEITVGEKVIADIPLEIWREQIAWISQTPYLFRDSVATNILLANPQASKEEIIHAAQLAHADEFIQELPHGYDTVIGERGARLSAGQAQRIALARGFLKDAPLLVLDEGIAHLDAITAMQVQESIQQLSKNRTVVIIAHQLSTIMQADRILVMDKGRIVQSGRHAELAQQEGVYRRLLESDFRQPAKNVEVENSGKPLFGNSHHQNIKSVPTIEINIDPKTNIPLLDTAHISPISTHRSPLAIFSRLLRLIAPNTGWIVLSALLGFATVASSVGLAATSAYIISAAALQPSIAVLQVAIVGVRFFGLSRGVFRYLERYVSHWVTLQVLGRLRVWFFEALEPLAPARLWMQHSGDLLSRIIGDISSLENFYMRAIYPPLVAILTAGLLGLYLGRYSSYLAIVMVALFLAVCTAIPWLMNHLAKNYARSLIEKRALLNERLVEGIQGLADLLIYRQEQHQMQRIDDASRMLEVHHQKMAMIGGLQTGLTGLASNLSLWIVLWITIPLVNTGLISGVFLASLALAALASLEALTPLPPAGQYLESNLQAARRLFKLVDAEPEVVDPLNPLPAPERFDLEVKRVSFWYPHVDLPPLPETGDVKDVNLIHLTPFPEAGKGEKPPLILHDLSFSLPQSKRMAIVGSSGVGKTTLVNLLLRFWDYPQGSILLNGKELRLYAQDDLRKRMAVVSQNTYLFNTTLRENLLLARPEANPEQLNAAIEQAQLADWVNTLPDGLDTWLGEQGVRLSAGERQRVAIARALLKDAPILILDEATANLDTITERRVMEAINKAMIGRSVIMVTHNWASLEAMGEREDLILGEELAWVVKSE
jgi:ATP-binding cassette subfamily C protein CydCD